MTPQQLALILWWGPPYFTLGLAEEMQSRPLYQDLIMLLRALLHLNHAADASNRVQIKSAHLWSSRCVHQSSSFRSLFMAMIVSGGFFFRQHSAFPIFPTCYRLNSFSHAVCRSQFNIAALSTSHTTVWEKILATTIYLEDKALNTFA